MNVRITEIVIENFKNVLYGEISLDNRYDKYVQSYTKFIQFILWHSRDMPSCFIEPDFANIAGYFRLV